MKYSPLLRNIGPEKWRVEESFIFQDLHIPVGFETDLDTVPRIPVFHMIFKNRTVFGAIVHDFCYRNKLGKEKSDKLFLYAMETEGVRKRYRIPIYYAVKFFGKYSYNK